MRFFKQKKKVLIRPEEIFHARQFAQLVTPTVNYRDSNQANFLKIQDDHFVSKVGEEATRKVFVHLGKQVDGPDYTIYHGGDKSWDEDLYVEDVGLAVKTQKWTAAERYGLSWTFQCSGFRTDPVLKEPDAWVCFVVVNDKDSSFSSIVFPPYQIKELTFGKPKLKHLWGKKQVVYARDLPVL